MTGRRASRTCAVCGASGKFRCACVYPLPIGDAAASIGRLPAASALRPACVFCGSVAEFCCAFNAAKKQIRIEVGEVRSFDNVAFRAGARRLWKVLRATAVGGLVELDLECRVKRMQRLMSPARRLTLVAVAPCLAPCCDLHVRDLGGGRHLCKAHWSL